MTGTCATKSADNSKSSGTWAWSISLVAARTGWHEPENRKWKFGCRAKARRYVMLKKQLR